MAEYLLAGALLAAAIALAADTAFGEPLAAAALGGTLYSSINSAGYYARERDRPMMVSFGVVDALAVASLAVLLT